MHPDKHNPKHIFYALHTNYTLARFLVADGYKVGVLSFYDLITESQNEPELKDMLEVTLAKKAFVLKEYDDETLTVQNYPRQVLKIFFQKLWSLCKQDSTFIHATEAMLAYEPMVSWYTLKDIKQIAQASPKYRILIKNSYINGIVNHEQYYDPIQSLISRTNACDSIQLQKQYIELLNNKNYLVSNILYSTSIQSDLEITDRRPEHGSREFEGGYIHDSNTIHISENISKPTIIHEMTHAVMFYINSDYNSNPYYNEKTQRKFEIAKRHTLYNFVEYLWINTDQMDSLTSWEIGKKTLQGHNKVLIRVFLDIYKPNYITEPQHTDDTYFFARYNNQRLMWQDYVEFDPMNKYWKNFIEQPTISQNNSSRQHENHGEAHKSLFAPNPYTTDSEKEFQIAKKKTLYNIAKRYSVVNDDNTLDQFTNNEIVAYINKHIHDTQQILDQLLIYRSSNYVENEENFELIAFYAQIMSDPAISNMKEILFSPITEYWQEFISPRIEEYLSIFDNSQFCAPYDTFVS